MPEPREKPKIEKLRAKNPAILSPKQAAWLLTSDYPRRLELRVTSEENETEYATGRAEGAAKRATEELAGGLPRFPDKKQKMKARQARAEQGDQPPGDGNAEAPQAVAVTKSVAKLIGSLAGLTGGGLLLIVLVMVFIVAAIGNSPFGLFFAEESGASDIISVTEAVSTVNMVYNAKLEEWQAGDYNSIVIEGQSADWTEVLAVFAARTAGTDNGVDVATLDADRVQRLIDVFWDMTVITTEVETVDHSGSSKDDPGWTEYILHITITAKTADDMRTQYSFTKYQNSALNELLAERDALAALIGNLTITDADISAILDALPDDLPADRREAVETALTLVGKVTYFWGGKSNAIGWDSQWGTLQKVTAPGSSTIGTYRPYGLDCSGYVDWVFNNSLGYVIGHGGGAASQHTHCKDISWDEAQPGDLAFYPDDSHVGIVVGRSDKGGILVSSCSSGYNNVVVSDCAASGFTAIARPDAFD